MAKIFGIVGTPPEGSGGAGMATGLQRMQLSPHLEPRILWNRPDFLLGALVYRGLPSPVVVSDGQGRTLFIHGELLDRGVLYTRDNRMILQVLLQRVALEGASALQDMDGIYTAILWDESARRLTLVTDRTARRRLHWCRDPAGRFVAFASDIWPLLPMLPRRRLDEQAVLELLTLGYPTEHRTIVDGISATGSAEVLTFDADGMKRSAYWDWSFRSTGEPVVSYADRLYDAVQRGVARVSVDERPTVIPLSGGKDSRLIASVAHAMRLWFTAANFGPPDCADAVFATVAARRMGFPLHRLLFSDDFIWRHAELTFLAYNGSIPLEQGMHWILTRLAEARIPTLFTGFLGDFVTGAHFTGYNTAVAARRGLRPRWGVVPQVIAEPVTDESAEFLLRFFFRRFQPEELGTFLQSGALAEQARGLIAHLRGLARHREFDSIQHLGQYLNVTQRQTRWIGATADLLSHDFVVRSPFASREIYDLCDTMSDEALLNQRAYTVMYQRRIREMAEVPTATGRIAASDGGALAYDLVSRLKRRVGGLFSGDGRAWKTRPPVLEYDEQIVAPYDDIRSWLAERRDAIGVWLEPDRVFRMLEDIRQGKDDEYRLARRFYAILTLVMAQDKLGSS